MYARHSPGVMVVLAIACAVHLPERQPEPGPLRSETRPPELAKRTACISRVAADRRSLSRPGPVVEIGERSFALMWRGTGEAVETVIVSLAADGTLTATAVPVPYADPTAIGADAGGLVVVSVPLHGTGVLLRVALGAEGGLRPGQPVKLPEVGWGWPSAIASDGKRAQIEHTLATAQQGLGPAMLYTVDLATSRVVASVPLAADRRRSCDDADCVTFATVPGSEGQPGSVNFERGGARLELELRSACPAVYEVVAGDERVLVAPGAPWRAVRSTTSSPFLREVAVDPGLAPEPGCGEVRHPFPSTSRPGLVEGSRGARTLLRWDAARGSFGAPESLPAQSSERSSMWPHADGVIEVRWDGGSGMMHSPTDAQGRRRYYEHWYFNGGQVALLRHEGGQWEEQDGVALALTLAEGRMGRGYEPMVLRHGLHAAVLLAAHSGNEAWFQPYLAPCAGP